MQSSVVAIIYSIGYLIAIIAIVVWFRKIKKRGEKIPLKAKIFMAFIVLSGPSVIAVIFSPSPSPVSDNIQSTTYYVKTKSANVRECPSTSCKVIDSLSQNTPLTFPGDLFDKYPDWTEITFPNGQVGYVSKTTLSKNIVPESQLAPTDDSSSVGGIIIGPWGDIQVTVGGSYEFHFCEPPSAISGATCGALADTTTDPRGGTSPYSFIKKSGFLPPGMTLELNGTLSGSPTQTGTYNFWLCAKDLYGGEGCQNLAVVVKKAEETIVDQPPYEEGLPPTEDNIALEAILISGQCGPSYRDESQLYEPKIRWDGWYWEADVSGPIETYMEASFADDIDCGAWHKIYENEAKCERISYSQPSTTRVRAKRDFTVYPPGVQSGIYLRAGSYNEKYVDFNYSCPS